MEIETVITSQYRAGLKMLKLAIQKCPPQMWDDPADKNRFWHVAYHALFYTHLYLQVDEAAFQPWKQHRPGYQFMGRLPWPPHDEPDLGEPYTQVEVLAYLDFCEGMLADGVAQLDFSGPSGFDWLPMNKLELQFYTIRHLQQHTGELCERLGAREKIDIGWVGIAPEQTHE